MAISQNITKNIFGKEIIFQNAYMRIDGTKNNINIIKTRV